MGIEHIDVKDQWGTVDAIKELTALEYAVVRFMEHTMQTMSQPRIIHGPHGEEHCRDEVEHPLGDMLGRIRAMRDACYKQYGKEMWLQGRLFDIEYDTTAGD